jgi:hypothetical protein
MALPKFLGLELLTLWLSATSVTAVRRLPNDFRGTTPDGRKLWASDTTTTTASTTTEQHRRLSEVNVAVPDQPDGHLVTNLPLLSASAFPTQHWAGLLPASAEGDKYLFYWLFAPDTSATKSTIEEPDIPLVM